MQPTLIAYAQPFYSSEDLHRELAALLRDVLRGSVLAAAYTPGMSLDIIPTGHFTSSVNGVYALGHWKYNPRRC